MPRVCAWALALVLFLVSTGPASAKDKVGADDLIKSMRKAVAAIGKQVKAGTLKTSEARHKPFLGALKQLTKDLDALDAALGKKDKAWFKRLSSTARTVGELEGGWEAAGVKSNEVSQALGKLVQAFRTLRKSYGPEAVRLKQKKALDADEQKKLAQLRRQNEALKAKLEALKTKVKEPSLGSALAGFVTEVTKLLAAEWTLDAYLEVLVWEELFVGEWTAWCVEVELVYPTYLVEFQVVTPVVVAIEHDVVAVIEEVELVEADLVVLEVEVEVEISLEVEGVSDAEVEALDEYVEELEVQVDLELEEGEAPGEGGSEMPGGDDDDKGGDDGEGGGGGDGGDGE